MPKYFISIESILSQISEPFQEGRAKGLFFPDNNIPVRSQTTVCRHQTTAQVGVVNIELQHRACLGAANSAQPVFVTEGIETGEIVVNGEFCSAAVKQVVEMSSFPVVVKFGNVNRASGGVIHLECVGGR